MPNLLLRKMGIRLVQVSRSVADSMVPIMATIGRSWLLCASRLCLTTRDPGAAPSESLRMPRLWKTESVGARAPHSATGRFLFASPSGSAPVLWRKLSFMRDGSRIVCTTLISLVTATCVAQQPTDLTDSRTRWPFARMHFEFYRPDRSRRAVEEPPSCSCRLGRTVRRQVPPA
jgi:hypothetical protein